MGKIWKGIGNEKGKLTCQPFRSSQRKSAHLFHTTSLQKNVLPSASMIFRIKYLSLRTVQRCENFPSGNFDQFCQSAAWRTPKTSTNNENVAVVAVLIKEDSWVTCEVIQRTHGNKCSSMQTTLKDHLGLSKVSDGWQNHCLTEEQKRRRVNFAKFFFKKFKMDKPKPSRNLSLRPVYICPNAPVWPICLQQSVIVKSGARKDRYHQQNFAASIAQRKQCHFLICKWAGCCSSAGRGYCSRC